MPLTIPPELKKITPYVRRAEELDRDKVNPESRVVAYYCRQYAVHAGISAATSLDGKACLGELLGNLEGEKKVMDTFTRDEAHLLCSKFANKIFDKADLEDRTGGATRETAKTFYAAASFLEILQQFYHDDDDSEESAEQKKKAVYSKWKATEILKAIKEGRTPTPGGYGEDGNVDASKDDEDGSDGQGLAPRDPSPRTANAGEPVTDEDSDDDNNSGKDAVMESNDPEVEDEEEDQGTEVSLGPPPAYPSSVPPPVAPSRPVPPVVHKPPLTFNLPPPMDIPPPPAKPLPLPTQKDSPNKKTNFLGFGNINNKRKDKLSKAELSDATELTKFALAALEDKDVDLAAERLQQALQVLRR
jgi:vacuolar protein sorting-associated protein VTA1